MKRNVGVGGKKVDGQGSLHRTSTVPRETDKDFGLVSDFFSVFLNFR